MKLKQEPVTVIIPAYNEEVGIYESIIKVKKILDEAQIEHEIIVVDDGSRDNTFNLAQKAGAVVIKHLKNFGYGASLKSGIKYAKNELIIITDADGTYPAKDLPEIILKMDEADMVVGSRVGQDVKIPWVRKPAKWFLKRLASYITGDSIPDLNSGLRAFRRECALQYFSILPDKFSFTTTITVAMICNGYNVVYIPIDYYKRAGKSKIVPWDFINFSILVIRLSMLFNPLKIFLPVSYLCIIFGLMKLIFDIVITIQNAQGLIWNFLFTHQVVSISALIFLISGLQILLIGMVADGITRNFSRHLPQKYQSIAVKYVPHEKNVKEYVASARE